MNNIIENKNRKVTRNVNTQKLHDFVPEYNIGDIVYRVKATPMLYTGNIENCQVCNGYKKIKIKGIEGFIACPKCSPFIKPSLEFQYLKYEYDVNKPERITSVITTVLQQSM